MATRSSTTPTSPPSADAGATRPTRPARWVLPLAVLAVALPFVVTAVRVLTGVEDSFRYGGDQAMAGLAVDEASDLERGLGPYSRYGWSHPGPLWFYLLVPGTRLSGGDDAALLAASVLVHGLLAAALVVAVHRAGRPALTLVVAALVLVFVLRMPATMFVDVWSPYALLIGTLLFLVLAARVHSGSWPALLAMLIAGSYLVQTHIGTAPLVVAVSAVGGVGFVLGVRTHRRAAERDATAGGSPRVARRRWTVALAALLVAVWIPPVVEQLTSPVREGNLARLVSFFLNHEEEGGSPSPFGALIAVGRLLAMTPYGWDAGPLEMDVSAMPASVGVALAAQALASAGLVVLGLRLRSRAGSWWGVVTLAALAAAVASAVTVTGTLFYYLIIWVAALPVATLIGYVHLALERRAADREAAPDRWTAVDRAPVPAALAAVGLVLSAAAAVALVDVVDALPPSTEITAASRLVDDGLADVEGRTVHVDMDPHGLWPIGAGVVRGLVSDGWEVSVDPGFTNLFGARRADAGGGPVDVLLVATDGPAHERLRGAGGVRDVGSFATQYGQVSVLVRVED